MPPTPISNMLNRLTPVERSRAKAVALMQAGQVGSFIVRGIGYTIHDLAVEGEALKVVVSAVRGGKSLKVDNPIYFINPPVKVPNGTTTETELPDGRLIQVPNHSEDAAAALREIIAQVVEKQNEG